MKEHAPGQYATAYRSDDGQMVVITNPTSVGIFHRASDEEPYTQCFGIDGSWSDGYRVFDANYSDPRDPKAPARLQRAEGSTDLDFNGTVYHLVDTPEKIEYVPLPTTRKQSWCYQLEDGRFFYVSQLVYDGFWPMGGSRFYLGVPADMKALTNPQSRLGSRTGISDRFYSDEGSLWTHGPYWQEGEGDDKTKVSAAFSNMSEFDIFETEEELVLTLKQPASA